MPIKETNDMKMKIPSKAGMGGGCGCPLCVSFPIIA